MILGIFQTRSKPSKKGQLFKRKEEVAAAVKSESAGEPMREEQLPANPPATLTRKPREVHAVEKCKLPFWYIYIHSPEFYVGSIVGISVADPDPDFFFFAGSGYGILVPDPDSAIRNYGLFLPIP